MTPISVIINDVVAAFLAGASDIWYRSYALAAPEWAGGADRMWQSTGGVCEQEGAVGFNWSDGQIGQSDTTADRREFIFVSDLIDNKR